MAMSGEPGSKIQEPISAEPIVDRFHSALSLEGNKPDAKDFADVGSPVSPLRTAAASSSSSSSGSFSGKPPSNAAAACRKSDSNGGRSHSGELSVSSESSPFPRSENRKSEPGSLIYSGAASSSVSSPVANVLPAGNICPSGKIGKPGMMSRSVARRDVLGSGTGNYGHGSIIRGGAAAAGRSSYCGEAAVGSVPARRMDPEEATKTGNEHYKKGQFLEALRFYDRAIELCPGNAACRSNRAAALTGIGRLGEAMKECEEAIRIDSSYVKAHQRLAGLHLRLGQVEHAQRHLSLAGQQPDSTEIQKLQIVERYLGLCADSRRMGDWKSVLREVDIINAVGVDSSPLLSAVRAEGLLRLHHLEEADLTLSKAAQHEIEPASYLQSKFLGMLSNSYIHFVRAQVEMALGRFENAVASVDKAHEIDPSNEELLVVWNSVKSVAKARSRGNELFKSGNFADACSAYTEGIKYDPSNPVLYCNRAACRSKMGQWERSVMDCNEALKIQPSYTKALLRRAASYAKLERWVEAVRDYEVLRKELPSDTEVAEALFHAQVALKTSRGEEVSNMKFGGEVEEITALEQLQAAISLPGVSIVYFMSAANQQCVQTTAFVEALCTRYPSLNFLKVEINGSPAIAKEENIRIVPTIKIYKNGARVKEMICPSQQVLEFSLRHYGN